MPDPKDQGMTAQEAAGRFCSWYVRLEVVSDVPWDREQAFWRATPELSEMLRHEIQDQSDDYAPVPLWATGRRVPVDPNRPPELLSTDMWRYLDLDIEGNQAAGGGLEYVDLRIYDAEPRADDATARDGQLQRAAEPHESSIAAPGGRAEATAATGDYAQAGQKPNNGRRARGRPSQRAAITTAYNTLVAENEVDFGAPKTVLYEPIRRKVREQLRNPSLEKGLGKEAIRITIGSLFDAEKERRGHSPER